MKKLVVALSIALIAVACNPSGSNKPPSEQAKPLPLQNGISLNGIDGKLATKMINQFDKIKMNDKHPTALSVWFSKEEIQDIVSLLDTEISHEMPQRRGGIDSTDDMIGITDGIRIYFACDTSATNLQNTTSIILVSTKDDGIQSDPAYPSGKKHIDYFDHSLNADLFKIGNINGAKCSGKSSCQGALLYPLICLKCQDDPNCPWSPHNIPIKQARRMVSNFGKSPINLTRGEWFDLSMWKTFVADKKSNGIRIYFATNSKCANGAAAPQANASLRDGFVITPTMYNQNTGGNDDHFDCNQAYLNNYNNFYKNKKRLLGPGQDQGELCPNNCD